ncbi:MAG: class II aldolase/adducin family protein [Candidatus Altiarchaeota archaeon]|nr:class II aldolase/adducin family protein [Candidatus Altiarchaeota archaeon]
MAEFYVGRKFRTEFVGGVREDSGVVAKIISAGKVLYSMGLTPENAGNISVRTRRGMLITIGGKSKGSLTPEDVVEVVSFDGETAKVVGASEPSSETPMHWMVYREFMGYNAVVHAHDEMVLEKARELGIPLTDHHTHYGTVDQARQVAAALRGGSYVAIMGHGIISAAESLEAALKAVVEFHAKVSR